MADPYNDFILGLPKAELHLHLEGTVDPPTLAELSRRHPTPLPTTNNRYRNIEDSGRVFSEEEARALYEYKNFTGFLWAFKAVTERLRTAEDYELGDLSHDAEAARAECSARRGVHIDGRGAVAGAGIRSAI